MEQLITARKADIGGLEVGRVLPSRVRRMVGPFIFLDHAGPVAMDPFVPRTMDVRPHPHIGLSTLSYLFQGELMHRDSIGCEQLIQPGDVNWMTAGRGVSHSERFQDEFDRMGGHLELLQAWVALPEAHEETAPTFHHLGRAELPVFQEEGLWARLIAGTAFGRTSPLPIHSPLVYMHVELTAGARAVLPPEHPERAVYVVRGRIEVGGHAYAPRQLFVFSKGETPLITAEEPSTLVFLGGEPLGHRYVWWNFVSSSRDRIEQAKEDWKAGRIALPIHDDRDVTPLPDWPKPRPEPIS